MTNEHETSFSAEQNQIVDELVSYFHVTRKGNKKVGLIYSWSITAGVSCTGKTSYCLKRCYAIKTAHRYMHARKRWDRNFEIAQRKDFAQLLTAALAQLGANLMRIHVSGDFFSSKYLLAWIEALEANPHIKPFAFTRGWRDPKIMKAIRLAGTPAWLLASTDPETGYDIPSGMKQADMVAAPVKDYRKAIKGLQKTVENVCPQQLAKNPETHESSVTCRSCGRCIGFKISKDFAAGGSMFVPVAVKSVTFMEH